MLYFAPTSNGYRCNYTLIVVGQYFNYFPSKEEFAQHKKGEQKNHTKAKGVHKKATRTPIFYFFFNRHELGK